MDNNYLLPEWFIQFFPEFFWFEIIVIHFILNFFDTFVFFKLKVFYSLIKGIFNQFSIDLRICFGFEVIFGQFILHLNFFLILNFLIKNVWIYVFLPLEILLIKQISSQLILGCEFRELLGNFVFRRSLFELKLFFLIWMKLL